jgi:hypothetical protein
MIPTLLVTTLAFAALAWHAPQIIDSVTSRQRMRRPHPHLILMFRVWFGTLALATVWLLTHPHHPLR